MWVASIIVIEQKGTYLVIPETTCSLIFPPAKCIYQFYSIKTQPFHNKTEKYPFKVKPHFKTERA